MNAAAVTSLQFSSTSSATVTSSPLTHQLSGLILASEEIMLPLKGTLYNAYHFQYSITLIEYYKMTLYIELIDKNVRLIL